MTLPVSFTQTQTCIVEEEAIRCKGVMSSFEKFDDRVEDGTNQQKESRFKDEDVTKTGGGIQSLLTALFGGWSSI
ncbi:unnamed protein product [Prunus armeniaca]|uniref:Uncharacterized protein n=1 Tax=Prunus armeniaca TaxID=36596 RepID=A0A6J5WBZ4_PRUAR|nr:unnamed protein product [Prunus armeniaca]CAB4297192.1 unnamed protein product [Prunus armeniaca]